MECWKSSCKHNCDGYDELGALGRRSAARSYRVELDSDLVFPDRQATAVIVLRSVPGGVLRGSWLAQGQAIFMGSGALIGRCGFSLHQLRQTHDLAQGTSRSVRLFSLRSSVRISTNGFAGIS